MRGGRDGDEGEVGGVNRGGGAVSVVDPGYLLLTSVGGNILNLLTFTLVKAGDVVLVAVPYYAAFDTDMEVRNSWIELITPLTSNTISNIQTICLHL